MKIPNYRTKSILLYLLACCLPVFFGETSFLGFHALTMGYVGFLDFEPTFTLPYVANFLYFGNLIFLRGKPRGGANLSLITITLGLFTFGIVEIPVHEGGLNADVFVGPGFMAWQASFIVLLLGQLNEMKVLSQ